MRSLPSTLATNILMTLRTSTYQMLLLPIPSPSDATGNPGAAKYCKATQMATAGHVDRSNGCSEDHCCIPIFALI